MLLVVLPLESHAETILVRRRVVVVKGVNQARNKSTTKTNSSVLAPFVAAAGLKMYTKKYNNNNNIIIINKRTIEKITARFDEGVEG